MKDTLLIILAVLILVIATVIGWAIRYLKKDEIEIEYELSECYVNAEGILEGDFMKVV